MSGEPSFHLSFSEVVCDTFIEVSIEVSIVEKEIFTNFINTPMHNKKITRIVKKNTGCLKINQFFFIIKYVSI